MNQHYKIQIIGHETQQNNKIVYVVHIKDQTTNRQKQTKLRYSQFKKIHQEIQQFINKLKLHIILPQFPNRKVFGSTNKSQQSIMLRKQQLNNYLNDLLMTERLANLDVVKKYYIPEQLNQQKNKTQQTRMTVCIDRYTLVSDTDTVLYYVRLIDRLNNQQWTFKARYSELRDIHQSLVQSKIGNLPPFPKKKLFGITNQSPDDIQRRRGELQKYFNQIFSYKQIVNSQTIKFFIQQIIRKSQIEKYYQQSRKKKKNPTE